MKMSRTVWIHTVLVIIVALAALFFVIHRAGGANSPSDSIAAGHHLADAWCKDCHSIETATAGAAKAAPDFTEIANRRLTTALSIKVFLKTNHPPMPNIIIAPDQADELANYILSLKRN